MPWIIWFLVGTGALYLLSPDKTRSQGVVLLKAGVPYRVEVLLPRTTVTTLGLDSALTALTPLLGPLGGTQTLKESSQGVLVSVAITPPTPLTIDFAAPGLGVATLRSITRMDGKDWNATP